MFDQRTEIRNVPILSLCRYHGGCDEVARLLPLRVCTLRARIRASLSLHALLLLNLPQDRRRRRLCHQSGRRQSDAEDDRGKTYRRVPRQDSRPEKRQDGAQLGPPAFLQAMWQRPVAMGSGLAGSGASARFRHRFRPAGSTRAHAHDAGVQGKLGRSGGETTGSEVRRVSG